MSFLPRDIVPTVTAAALTLHQYFDDTIKNIAAAPAGCFANDRRYDEDPLMVASKLMVLTYEYAAASDATGCRRERALLGVCHDARLSFDLPLNYAVMYESGDAVRIMRSTFKASF